MKPTLDRINRAKQRFAFWTARLMILTIVSVILAIWFSWGWKVTATLAVLAFLGIVLYGIAALAEQEGRRRGDKTAD